MQLRSGIALEGACPLQELQSEQQALLSRATASRQLNRAHEARAPMWENERMSRIDTSLD